MGEWAHWCEMRDVAAIEARRRARDIASAIEARSGQTEGLDPKGESAAPEGGDAQ